MTTNPLTVDIGSEGGVLGSMLLDRNVIPVVRAILPDRYYFSKEEHRILYGILCELHESVDPQVKWDLVLVRHGLIQRKKLDAVGDVEYLIRLAESTPTTANAEHYAKCIRAAYRRKQVADMGESMKTLATEPLSLKEAVNAAMGDLHELSCEIDDKPRQTGAEAVKTLIDDAIGKRRLVVRLPWRAIGTLSCALQPGTVTLLCGTPGASKSFAALELMNTAIEAGHLSAYFALEDSKAFHLSRMLAQKTGLSGLTNPDWICENPIIAQAAHQENETWLNQMGMSIEATGGGQATYGDLTSWSLRRAKDGHRLLIIDPVTAIRHTQHRPWEEDNDFLQRIKRIAVDFGCVFILVTHPAKCEGRPSMELLAGGASFSRFAQTIFWLEYHEAKTSSIRFDCGTSDETHNRTLHILKARLGKGQGLRIAMTFTDGLTLKEHGIIVKKKKRQSDDE